MKQKSCNKTGCLRKFVLPACAESTEDRFLEDNLAISIFGRLEDIEEIRKKQKIKAENGHFWGNGLRGLTS